MNFIIYLYKIAFTHYFSLILNRIKLLYYMYVYGTKTFCLFINHVVYYLFCLVKIYRFSFTIWVAHTAFCNLFFLQHYLVLTVLHIFVFLLCYLRNTALHFFPLIYRFAYNLISHEESIRDSYFSTLFYTYY